MSRHQTQNLYQQALAVMNGSQTKLRRDDAKTLLKRLGFTKARLHADGDRLVRLQEGVAQQHDTYTHQALPGTILLLHTPHKKFQDWNTNILDARDMKEFCAKLNQLQHKAPERFTRLADSIHVSEPSKDWQGQIASEDLPAITLG